MARRDWYEVPVWVREHGEHMLARPLRRQPSPRTRAQSVPNSARTAGLARRIHTDQQQRSLLRRVIAYITTYRKGR